MTFCKVSMVENLKKPLQILFKSSLEIGSSTFVELLNGMNVGSTLLVYLVDDVGVPSSSAKKAIFNVCGEIEKVNGAFFTQGEADRLFCSIGYEIATLLEYEKGVFATLQRKRATKMIKEGRLAEIKQLKNAILNFLVRLNRDGYLD